MFNENPCVKTKNEKIYSWSLVFPGFSVLRYGGSIYIVSAHARGLFSCIYLRFLLKYRCVPKVGSPADISIDMFLDISIDISIGIVIDSFIDIFIDIFLDISIDILIDISIDVSIDNVIDMLIDILSDKEEGGGRRKEWTSC